MLAGAAPSGSCTTGKERGITRWEHEHILEAVQRRLDEHPEKMRQRRETVEHPFRHHQGPDGCNPLPDEDAATGSRRDGAARTRLQYDRVINIMGTKSLMALMKA